MTQQHTAQAASFFFAALMTLGMLGGVASLASTEHRLGADALLVAQATAPAASSTHG